MSKSRQARPRDKGILCLVGHKLLSCSSSEKALETNLLTPFPLSDLLNSTFQGLVHSFRQWRPYPQ